MPPTLDAHAHLDLGRWLEPRKPFGAVLAVTLSAAEAAACRSRSDDWVAWGVGCHPRDVAAQRAFTSESFASLMAETAFVGEIGLDRGGRVPSADQLTTFRQALALVAEMPRIVSIHASRAESAVLDELERTPIAAPILHRFEGTADDATRAVELGCYFSVHTAVARRTLFRKRVPLNRILVESDHGYDDPPAAIPLRIGWVEHLVAHQYGVTPEEVRTAAWANLARLVAATGTRGLLPAGIAAALPA